MKWGSHWRLLSRDMSDAGFQGIALLAQQRKGWVRGKCGSKETSTGALAIALEGEGDGLEP